MYKFSKLLIIYTIMVLLVGAGQCFADYKTSSIKLSYNLFTTHGSGATYENDVGEEIEYNNNNRMIGLAYKYNETSSIGVGYMEQNSYYQESYVLDWDNWIRLGEFADLGSDLFLASGYEELVGDFGIMPGVLPYIRMRPFGTDHVSLKVGMMNFMATVGFIEFHIDL